ncbi:MAG: acyltransferase, partial [Clostridiales bacterium]|nr:acyltransferase [Clostridiales bacterium]
MNKTDNPLSRDYNVDLMKIIACIAVVGLHTFKKDISVLNSTLYYLYGFAVPVFFVSGGAFLMNRKTVSLRYIIKKIITVLKVVVIWNIIITGVYLASDIILHTGYEFTLLTIPKKIIKCLVQKGTLWHFWYFGALIILYIMLPILHRLKERHRKLLAVAMIVIALVIQLFSLIKGEPLQKNVIQTFRLWTWLLYFIGGGLVYSYVKNKKGDFPSHISILLTIIILFVLIYQNIIGRYVIKESMEILHVEYFYDSLFTMLW